MRFVLSRRRKGEKEEEEEEESGGMGIFHLEGISRYNNCSYVRSLSEQKGKERQILPTFF